MWNLAFLDSPDSGYSLMTLEKCALAPVRSSVLRVTSPRARIALGVAGFLGAAPERISTDFSKRSSSTIPDSS